MPRDPTSFDRADTKYSTAALLAAYSEVLGTFELRDRRRDCHDATAVTHATGGFLQAEESSPGIAREYTVEIIFREFQH
jgi:hypothetical protein